MKMIEKLIEKSGVSRNEIEEVCKIVKDNLELEGNMTKKEKYEIDYRYEHSLRVADLAMRIVDGLYLSDYSKRIVLFAALFHDISKFTISSRDHGELATLYSNEVLKRFKYNDIFINNVAVCLKNHSDKENYRFDKYVADKRILLGIIIEADTIDHLSYQAFKHYGFTRNGGTYDEDKISKIINKFKYYDPDNNFSIPGKELYNEFIFPFSICVKFNNHVKTLNDDNEIKEKMI